MLPQVFHLQYPWGVSWTGLMLFFGARSILIDTALAEAVQPWLEEALLRRNLKFSSLAWVVNTHFHADHAGGNMVLRSCSDAGFAIHESGAAGLADAGFIPDRLLRDGDELDGGDFRVRLFHTPGHSIDSSCVFDAGSGTLFTGDSLQGRGSVFTGIALYNDPAEYRNSIRKVRDLIDEYRIHRLCLGHAFSGTTGEVRDEKMLEFLSDCEDRVELYDQFLREMVLKNPEISPDECGRNLLRTFGLTTTPSMPQLARITATAHLRRIVSDSGTTG